MIKLTVRNTAAEPPARFNKKHEKWARANFEGAVTLPAAGGIGEIAQNLDHVFTIGGKTGVSYQLIQNNKMITVYSSLQFSEMPAIGKTLKAMYWDQDVAVTFEAA